MASKKDLVEAQGFSRRRLLTAFVSGAPGGRELEPTKPLRAVVGGLALTALVVVASLATGMFSPTLPAGWGDNKLLVTNDAKTGGSRYVAISGVLYPSLNLTSARLVIPATAFQVLLVSETNIAAAKRGPTVGITGAPDALPARANLIKTGWLDCTWPTGETDAVLSKGGAAAKVVAGARASGTDAAGLLVTTANNDYLITGGHRYLIPSAHSGSVLRAVGQDTTPARTVSARWLNLFPPGADLAPITIDGAGSPVPGSVKAPQGAVVGSVLSVASTGTRYVVDAAGTIGALSAFASPMYQLGSGGDHPDIKVTTADIENMASSKDVGPANWPSVEPVVAPAGGAACAVLSSGAAGVEAPVRLAFSADLDKPKRGQGVEVDPSAGALVRAGARGTVQLIDQSGTAFPVPQATGEILARLGFQAKDVTVVPPAWLGLFHAGPALTVKAAQGVPQAPGA